MPFDSTPPITLLDPPEVHLEDNLPYTRVVSEVPDDHTYADPGSWELAYSAADWEGETPDTQPTGPWSYDSSPTTHGDTYATWATQPESGCWCVRYSAGGIRSQWSLGVAP